VRRRLVAALALVLSVAVGLPAPARADTLAPSQWPTGVALGSAPNALRVGGVDRYATGLASALTLRGEGEQPFASADRTSGGARTLAVVSSWWGASTCPGSVIVVAGDTPADALAAASLSDPTNRSDEPRLPRVAAADPTFDQIGALDRVDTFAAPIIVTASTRAGATALSASAATAVADLRSGGCRSAREAIIVGGEQAVPVGVETELLALGYEEVFRVAGANRFETATRILDALGTEPAPSGVDCVDELTDDGSTQMGFYGNAVFEFRPSAQDCQVHGRAVVLADGSVGADALAAGWFTSYWQIPVLLVAGDGTLPEATREALDTAPIDTIIVLGGTARIPEAVVEEAASLARAVVGRFAGPDRYATSARTAEVFGGWHGTGSAADFDGDRLCFAASSGTTRGWPDALTAGPLCGRLSALPTRTAPTRMLEPVGPSSRAMTPSAPSHHATPLLLVPAGATPTTEVASLLAGAFAPSVAWCTTEAASGCRRPGFALAFGGTASVSDGALAVVSVAVSGSGHGSGDEPSLERPFRTSLDMAPLYATDGAVPSACVETGAVRGARWLAVYGDPALTVHERTLDLNLERWSSDGELLARCVSIADAGPTPVLVAVSAAGRVSSRHLLGGDDGATTMSGPMTHDGPLGTTGAHSSTTDGGTTTGWRFREAPSAPLELVVAGERQPITEATVTLTLERDTTGVAGRFTAALRILTAEDVHTGTVRGDAVLTAGRWELAGPADLDTGRGGWRATLETLGPASESDDRLTWRVDAHRP
jgi:hypothetical protein